MKTAIGCSLAVVAWLAAAPVASAQVLPLEDGPMAPPAETGEGVPREMALIAALALAVPLLVTRRLHGAVRRIWKRHRVAGWPVRGMREGQAAKQLDQALELLGGPDFEAGLGIEPFPPRELSVEWAARLRRAERILDEVLAARPDEPRAVGYKGVIAALTRRSQVAVECLTRYCSLAPGVPFGRYALAQSLLALGWSEQAEEALRDAVAAAPGEPLHRARLMALLAVSDRPETKLARRETLRSRESSRPRANQAHVA